MSLEINHFVSGKQVILYPKGDIDIVQAEYFKQYILPFIEKEYEIVIDGQDLEYLDSTGLGMMMGIHKQLLSYNQLLQLSNMKSSILKILDITGLNKIFKILEGGSNV